MLFRKTYSLFLPYRVGKQKSSWTNKLKLIFKMEDKERVLKPEFPEVAKSLVLPLPHEKQQFNWDCGLACVRMVGFGSCT